MGGVASKNFSKVESRTVGQLRDLLAATETVGDKDRGWGGGLNGGQEILVGNGLGNFKFSGFKAEWARHSATASLNKIDHCSGRAEKRDFTSRAAKNCFVMAVTVDQNFCACEATRGKLRCAIGEPVGEQPDVLAQTFCSGIVGEEFQQLVFEDAGATWFKEDERHAGLDLRRHEPKHARKIGAGSAEKAEIVEWATAADVAARGFDLKAGFKKDGFGRGERLRIVVVVPRIRPQQHLRCGRLLDEIRGRG